MKTIYVTIGNSDDKLSQNEWAHFVAGVDHTIREQAFRVHGQWFSMPDAPWQNACWCVEVDPGRLAALKDGLRLTAKAFRQDSIAWAEAPAVEFLG